MVILYHRTPFGTTERAANAACRLSAASPGPAVPARGDDPPEPPGGLRPREPGSSRNVQRAGAARERVLVSVKARGLRGLVLAAEGEVAWLAEALDQALSAWSPGERDWDSQARVAAALEGSGADAPFLIVGGDDRVRRYRHPMAAGAPVRHLAMAVVVARRGGLHAAATRFASAVPLSA